LEQVQLARDNFRLAQDRFDLETRKQDFNEKLVEAEQQGVIDEKQAEDIKANEQALQTLQVATRVLNHPALGAATGPVGRFVPSPRTFTGSTADFVGDFEQLVNLLTVENLDLMSGVLSESDIQILKGAATKLNRGLPTQSIKDEVGRIISTLSREIGSRGITAEQGQFYFGITPEETTEIDSIFGVGGGEFNPDDFLN
jgi:hypothetical protein